MATFRWQGVSPRGEMISGQMEAPSRDAVIARLRGQRIRPLPRRIRERGRGLDREISIPGLRDAVKPSDLVVFTRQLATMIEAGLPIVQCLDVLATETPKKALRTVIGQLRDEVETGATLTDALRKHGRLFEDFYTSMVAAGEIAGSLDVILNRLAQYLEKSLKLKRKLTGAMIYPAAVVAIAIIATVVLLIWVIPVFAEMFSSFGKALPAPTQFVINLSRFTVEYSLSIAGTAAAVAVGVRQFYRAESGRRVFDLLFLALPVFGDLIRKSSVARFTRTLSTLLSSGVPILDALLITARTAGNAVVERSLLSARVSISEGNTIADPLRQSSIFPPMVCQMIGVGEATGSLDAMLQKIAEFYEDEVDQMVNNLTTLMEPLVILVLGVVIGGLVISMYLPIFQLGSVIN